VPFDFLAGAPLDVLAAVFGGGGAEVTAVLSEDSPSFVGALRSIGSELS